MENVLIIIPAFNEEEAIYNTVKQVISSTSYDYIVINDGSTDQTGAILDQHDINHIDLPANLGIGGAMQAGYKYAYRNGYDYAIQLDADGQHNPKDIDNLLVAIKEMKTDMVIGSRFVEKTNYKGHPLRRVGIYYFYMMLFAITGQKITDPTSGYRIVNRRIIEEFAKRYPIDYPEVEVIVDLKKKGYRIYETKVDMNNRLGGQSSITPMKSIYYIFKVTCFCFIRKVFS